MAGYALGFDDGGDVPEETPGAAPAEAAAPAPQQDDAPAQATLPDMGDPPYMQTLAQATPGEAMQATGQQIGSDMQQGVQNVQKNPLVKRVVSYLMGDGAADPAAANKFALGVKHEYPNVSPDDANLLAVQKAFELGGPEAAWSMVQYNRTAYNAKQSFAEAALQGVPGQKPPDIHAAADAATQATQHILDGSSSQFRANDDGTVTATVKLPGTKTAQTYQLSPEAFSKFVQVGKEGQYDRVFEQGGVPATLARLAGNGSVIDASSTAPATPDAAAPAAPAEDRAAQLKKAMGDYPVSQDDLKSGYDPDTIAKGYARFGHGVAQAGERNEWMAQQEDKEANRENAVTVAQEKGKLANERARITGTGRVQQEEVRQKGQNVTAGTKVQGANDVADKRADAYNQRTKAMAAAAVQKQEAAAKSAEEKARLSKARLEINDPNTVFRKPGDVDAIFKKYGLNGSPAGAPEAPQGETPQAAAPTQVQVPPINQRETNKVYTTPKGRFRWNGKGWLPE